MDTIRRWLRPPQTGHRDAAAVRYRQQMKYGTSKVTIARIGLGAAIGAGYAVLFGLLLFAGQALRTPQFALGDIRPSDGLVVLTGGENRVREGLRLMIETPVRRVLISGVYRSTTHDDFRRHFGLPSVLSNCCLDIGYAAQDTVGNADETRAWVKVWGFQRVIVVTSGYHMPRSMLELRRALPHIQLIPHPVSWGRENKPRWWVDSGAMRVVLREYSKLLLAVVRF